MKTSTQILIIAGIVGIVTIIGAFFAPMDPPPPPIEGNMVDGRVGVEVDSKAVPDIKKSICDNRRSK